KGLDRVKQLWKRLPLQILSAMGVFALLTAGFGICKVQQAAGTRAADELPQGAVARIAIGNEVRSVSFSPDAKTLAVAALDNDLPLWDAATGKELRRFRGHVRGVVFAGFPPGGMDLLSAGYNNIRVWDVATAKELRKWDLRELNVAPSVN